MVNFWVFIILSPVLIGVVFLSLHQNKLKFSENKFLFISIFVGLTIFSAASCWRQPWAVWFAAIYIILVYFVFCLKNAEESTTQIKCMVALSNQNHEKVVELVSPGLEKNWKNFSLFAAASISAAQIRQLDKAEEFANRAFQINPHHQNSRLAMFAVKSQQLKCDEAEVFAEELLPKKNFKAGILFERARMYLLSHQFPKALTNLEELETLPPTPQVPEWLRASLRVEILIGMNKLTNALELCKKVREQWHDKLPQSQSALLDHDLGYAYFAQQNWSEAIDWFTSALKKDPQLSSSLLLRSVCYIEEIELEKARQDLNEFDHINKIPALDYDAQCYKAILSPNAEEAKALVEQTLKVVPDSTLAHFILGRILIQNEEFETALSHLNRAIELNPMFHQAYNLRALTYRALNEWDKTEEDDKMALVE